MLRLTDYQQTTVDELVNWYTSEKKTVTLWAPTGAGKTVILGSVIKHITADTHIIWITPGKGNLAHQSFTSLINTLRTTNVNVKTLNGTYLTENPAGSVNSVVVTNWEKLIQGAGKGKHQLLRNGNETHPGIVEYVENTTKNNVPVVLIIDEAHYGGKTGSQISDLKELLNQKTKGLLRIIDATATPSSAGEQVKVDVDAVIAEGVITENVRVNDGFKNYTEEKNSSADQKVITAGVAKLKQLQVLYREENSDVKPLLLLQIPNYSKTDNSATEKLDTVLTQLNQEGFSISNNQIYIWLEGAQTRDDTIEKTIADNSSPVEIIIFKQAIDLGWDCPRANVLVSLRDSKSEQFKTQLVGRIMRMPERKHYLNSELNSCYVYTPLSETYSMPKGAPENSFIKKPLQKTPTDPISLPASFVTVVKNKTVWNATDIVSAWRNETKNGLKLYDVSTTKREVIDSQTVGMEETFTQNVTADESSSVLHTLTPKEMEDSFNETILGPLAQNTTNREILRTALLQSVSNDLADNLVDKMNYLYKATSAAENREIVVTTLFKILTKLYGTPEKRVIENYNWRPAEEILVALEDGVGKPVTGLAIADKYLYKTKEGVGTYFTTLSGPEREFVKFLNKQYKDKIAWWWKNGESGVAQKTYELYYTLSYVNPEDGLTHNTFPDFIVGFTNGTIGVFEVKDSETSLTIPVNLAKHRAICNIGDVKVFGGVVAPGIKNVWLVSSGNETVNPALLSNILLERTHL